MTTTMTATAMPALAPSLKPAAVLHVPHLLLGPSMGASVLENHCPFTHAVLTEGRCLLVPDTGSLSKRRTTHNSLQSSMLCAHIPQRQSAVLQESLQTGVAYHEGWLLCASACASSVTLAAAGKLAAPEGGSTVAPQVTFKYCMPSGMGQPNWLSCSGHSFSSGPVRSSRYPISQAKYASKDFREDRLHSAAETRRYL